jgi:hypothetical protein
MGLEKVINMKYTRLTVALLLVSSFCLALTTSSVAGSGSVYTVTQMGVTQVVNPVENAQTSVDFYDYFSASGHNPFMEDGVSKVYLYKNTDTGVLSLIMHHSIDNTPDTGLKTNFNLEGVPAGATTAFSDDPVHTWNASRPGGREFDLTLEPEGNWRHGRNSDGGIIDNLPTGDGWCMKIYPEFISGIDEWQFLTSNGPAVEDVAEIDLDMDLHIQICCSKPAPGPLFSDILVILPLGIMAATLIVRQRRK